MTFPIITQTAPGHYDITCPASGLPLDRAGPLGIFCAAQPCDCEEKSKDGFATTFGVLRDLIDIIGPK